MNDLKGIIEDCNKSDLVSKKVIKKVIEIIGQEEWNDLYDEQSDICTTMGELIITLKGIPDLETENKELKEVHESDKRSLRLIAKKGLDLEKKISILLSCKNCPDNKGGYICQKEYEDKCLAQKIQYIKELQEENAELKEELRDANEKVVHLACNQNKDLKYKLTKAKEIISNLYAICKDNHYPNTSVLIEQTEQFLKECE